MKSIVEIRSKEQAEVFRARLEAIGSPTYVTRRWGSGCDKRVTMCLCCGTLRYDERGDNVLYCHYCNKPHVFNGEINPWFEQPEHDPAKKKPAVNEPVLGLLETGVSAVVFWDGSEWYLLNTGYPDVDVVRWKNIYWKREEK